jgi:hypothetical protein
MSSGCCCPWPFISATRKKALPPVFFDLPLTISVGAGDDLSIQANVPLTPVKWYGRPSTGTSATNTMYNSSNPADGLGGAAFTTGELGGKPTLDCRAILSGAFLEAWKDDMSAARNVNRIIAAVDTDDVNPANYSSWMLVKINSIPSPGYFPIMGTADALRWGVYVSDTDYLYHEIWFNTSYTPSMTHSGSGVWQVFWNRHTSVQIQSAINSGVWTTSVNGINFFPGGMNQPFRFAEVNAGLKMEIADVGVMPGTIGDVDREAVMQGLRDFYDVPLL